MSVEVAAGWHCRLLPDMGPAMVLQARVARGSKAACHFLALRVMAQAGLQSALAGDTPDKECERRVWSPEELQPARELQGTAPATQGPLVCPEWNPATQVEAACPLASAVWCRIAAQEVSSNL